jgi:hypothetical protein
MLTSSQVNVPLLPSPLLLLLLQGAEYSVLKQIDNDRIQIDVILAENTPLGKAIADWSRGRQGWGADGQAGRGQAGMQGVQAREQAVRVADMH